MFITLDIGVGAGTGAGPTRIDRMSDHTERLRKLRARIVAAKEFL
jgi:hypothetical protein